MSLHLALSLPAVVLLLPASCFKGGSQATGPPQPIVAAVGDDVTLPCHLKPAVDASPMTVEWARPDLEPRFVYVWRDGVELESKKHPSYKGRTSASIDRLKLGDVSLKLSKVKLSDKGRYRCFVPTLRDSFIELVVGVVSSPLIAGINISSSGVVLQCESEGWYPEPEVLWLDAEGNLLSAGPTETVRGPDDLYTVSSRVTVEKRHSNSFTCRVQQKDINQTRETHIHVSDDVFSVPQSSTVCIKTCVVTLVLILCSFAVAFFCWRWKQKKSKQTNHEDGDSVRWRRRQRKLSL